MTPKDKQHFKEMKSFQKRLGKHIVWFESLSEKAQKNIFFAWKSIKYRSSTPISIRKYIYGLKKRYIVPRHQLRDKTIEKLLS